MESTQLPESQTSQNPESTDISTDELRAILKQSPASTRLIGFTDQELHECPWLEELKNGQITDFSLPSRSYSNSIEIPTLISKDQIEEPQTQVPGTKTCDEFKEIFSQDVLLEDRDSIPITGDYSFNPKMRSTLVENHIEVSQQPIQTQFLVIHQCVNNSIGTSKTAIFCDIFLEAENSIPETYAMSGLPLTESIRISFSPDGQGHFHSFGKDISADPLIPFPAFSNVKLIAYLSMIIPSANEEDQRADIIGVAEVDISKESVFSFQPKFFNHNPLLPISTNVKTGKQLKTFIIDFQVEVKDISHNSQNAIMPTAYNNFYPSPLLSIGNISLECTPKLLPSNSRIYLQASLKSPDQSTTFKLAMSINSNSLSESISSMPVKVPEPQENQTESVKIYFPDVFLFHLLPNSFPPGSLLTLSLFSVSNDQTKKKLLFTCSKPIVKPFDPHFLINIDLGNLFTQKQASIKCMILYPVICSPSPSVLKFLTGDWAEPPPVDSDPMFTPASLYCIDSIFQHLSSSINFSFISSIILVNLDQVLQWVDHFFTPTNDFLKQYYSLLGDSLTNILETPTPFFRIVFKSLFSLFKSSPPTEEDIDLLKHFFTYSLKIENTTITISYAELLLRLILIFEKDTILDIAYSFISILDNSRRFLVFQILFSDLEFVKLLGMNGIISWERPTSPFVPVLSLFLSSLEETLIENNEKNIIAPAEAVAILANSLEQFTDTKSATQCAQTFFPLLSCLFTFHDSFKIKINNDIPITPFILFILKNVSKEQFFQYYAILSPDNRLRFFEFLSSQALPETIQDLTEGSSIWKSKNTEFNKIIERKKAEENPSSKSIMTSVNAATIHPRKPLPTNEPNKRRDFNSLDGSVSPLFDEDSPIGREILNFQKTIADEKLQVLLSISLEVTWRILHFVQFFQQVPELFDSMGTRLTIDSKLEHAIFSLLIKLLLRNKQSDHSVTIVLHTLALFVAMYAKTIFFEQNPMLLEIISALVEISQRNIFSVRNQAIGFIKMLFEMEEKITQNTARCQISLTFSVAETYFAHNEFRNIFEEGELDKNCYKSARKLYNQLLNNDKESLIIEQKIKGLLSLADKYIMFPNIVGLIYQHIAILNEENGAYPSAFISEWKLCALISDVFQLNGIKIRGIPEDGSDSFPYISNIQKPDLSDVPEDARCFATFSDFPKDHEMFTPDFIELALKKARDLCALSQFPWILGDITEFSVMFLEKRREFSVLADLFQKAESAYNDLFLNDKNKLVFTRVFIGGKLSKQLGFKSIIRILQSTDQNESDLLNRLQVISPETTLADKTNEPISDEEQDIMQEIQVECDEKEIHQLKANTFYFDEKKDAKQWDEIFIIRHIYTTANPLPYYLPFVEIANDQEVKLKKSEYYIEQLKKYSQNLLDVCQSTEKVLPPPNVLLAFKEMDKKLVARKGVETSHFEKLVPPAENASSEEWRKWRKENRKIEKQKEIEVLFSKRSAIGLRPEKILELVSNVLESLENAEAKPYFALVMNVCCPDGLPRKEDLQKEDFELVERFKNTRGMMNSVRIKKTKTTHLDLFSEDGVAQSQSGERKSFRRKRSNTAGNDKDMLPKEILLDEKPKEIEKEHKRVKKTKSSELGNDIPKSVLNLIFQIWDQLKTAMGFIDKIVIFNTIDQPVELKINQYKRALGIV